MLCLDPMSLLPHNHPQPQEGETLPMNAIRRATSILRFIPDRDECELILERWRKERRWICRSSEANLFTASACLRGLLRHNSCADDMFDPVEVIVETQVTSDSNNVDAGARLRTIVFGWAEECVFPSVPAHAI